MSKLNKMPIRKVLRSGDTGLLLAEDGTWTDTPDRAADFADIIAAMKTCECLNLENISYILSFDGETFPVSIPIVTKQAVLV